VINVSIGKGLIKIDDYSKFGKMCDELGEYASIITYVPKANTIIIVVRDELVNTVLQMLKEYKLTVKEISKGRGIMRFIKATL